MFLDELNKIAITEALNATDDYDELTDEEIDELLNENIVDVDLNQLEKDISMKENYNVIVEEVEEHYFLTI